MRYETVIYLDGDSYDEWEAIMYPDRRPAYLPVPTGYDEALAHLMQWECGEPTESYDSPPWGGDEYTHTVDGYVMAWHPGLSHASLTRVMPDEDTFDTKGTK